MTKLVKTFSSKYFEAAQNIKGSKKRVVRVFVEGYDDVSFWRGVFDDFENDKVRFEITVPVRGDLAKGKKVVMSFIPDSGENLILCVDSDFDYLFGDQTEQSKVVNNSKYLFQTYAYATENYICYPPSLHSLCVKATKNDTKIFDFEYFMAEYSKAIYPIFLWYIISARKSTHKVFTLADFRNTVRINYLDVTNNGDGTIVWLRRQIGKRRQMLEKKNPGWMEEIYELEKSLRERGVTPETVHFYMQGHTLKDNIVIVVLQRVCDVLRDMNISRIMNSDRRGVSLKNEQSNYSNSLRNIKEVLSDNERYKDCHLYKKLMDDVNKFINEIGE